MMNVSNAIYFVTLCVAITFYRAEAGQGAETYQQSVETNHGEGGEERGGTILYELEVHRGDDSTEGSTESHHISRTGNMNVKGSHFEHHDSLTINVLGRGEGVPFTRETSSGAAFSITIDAHLQKRLFGDNLEIVSRYSVSGVAATPPSTASFENCYYTGNIVDLPGAIVSLSTCGEGIEGEIHTSSDGIFIITSDLAKYGLESHHIQQERGGPGTTTGRGRGRPGHYLFRQKHLIDPLRPITFCDHGVHGVESDGEGGGDNYPHTHTGSSANKALFLKSNYRNLDAGGGTLFVETLVVNDNDFIAVHGSPEKATAAALDIMNRAALFYRNIPNYDIQFVVTRVENWVGFDIKYPIADLNDYLEAFKDFWQTSPDGRHKFQDIADATLLFTEKEFKGTVAGVSYVGTLCSDWSLGVCKSRVGMEGAIVAHELGHIFGSKHDGDGNECSASGFLMGAVIDREDIPWSTCSLTQISNYLTGLFRKNNGESCLSNAPTIVNGSDVVTNVSLNRIDDSSNHAGVVGKFIQRLRSFYQDRVEGKVIIVLFLVLLLLMILSCCLSCYLCAVKRRKRSFPTHSYTEGAAMNSNSYYRTGSDLDLLNEGPNPAPSVPVRVVSVRSSAQLGAAPVPGRAVSTAR